MPKEFEHAFFNFNKKNIISKIKEMNGKCAGIYLFRVQVLFHPLNTVGTYVRVRDEGFRITMTYKFQEPNDKYAQEEEIIIDNFDNAVAILLGLGCKKKYYYEKIREIWHIKNTEFAFDTNPGIDERLEIESKTLKEMKEMINMCNLTVINNPERYMDLFGISMLKPTDLTFKNVKKDLIDSVKKNKEQFIKIVDEQLIKYNKLIKKLKK
jgi:predicted adenylyl cyclase CyaB